jgi:hypothetical protein
LLGLNEPVSVLQAGRGTPPVSGGVLNTDPGFASPRPANLGLWSDVRSEFSRYLARLDQGEGDVRYAVSLGGHAEGGIAIGKGRAMERMTLDRITANPAVMGGKPPRL